MLLKDVYNAKMKNIGDKIPDITNLATKATLNAKINEAKGGILSTTNLAANTSLTAVENKMNMLAIQSKKLTITQKLMKLKRIETDHDHSNKYITTTEFNNLVSENFAAQLKQANLASKSDIA